MQTDNHLIETLRKEGFSRLLAYGIGLFFVLKSVFGWIDNGLRNHYQTEIEAKHESELLLLDSKLEELETALSERAKVQKVEVLKTNISNQKAISNQKETAKKIEVYEKSGLVVTENSVSVAVNSIDSLRAKLKAEREARKRLSN